MIGILGGESAGLGDLDTLRSLLYRHALEVNHRIAASRAQHS